MTNQLEQLKRYTKVVADTGDFDSIREYKPQEATTNPSLILQAVQKAEYKHLLESAVAARKGSPLSGPKLVDAVIDCILVNFGIEILKIVPGRVSTEIDARLSFDREATQQKARHIIGLYGQAGIDRERILIKIAAPWEGIKAAEALQKKGVNCNLTLLFSLVQAVASAEGGVKLISPFVGRILDGTKRTQEKNTPPRTIRGCSS